MAEAVNYLNYATTTKVALQFHGWYAIPAHQMLNKMDAVIVKGRTGHVLHPSNRIQRTTVQYFS